MFFLPLAMRTWGNPSPEQMEKVTFAIFLLPLAYFWFQKRKQKAKFPDSPVVQ